MGAVEPDRSRQRGSHGGRGDVALRRSLVLVMTVLACGVDDDTDRRPTKPPFELQSTIDRAEAMPGDILTFEIAAEYDSHYDLELPSIGERLAGLEVIGFGQQEDSLAEGRVGVRRWYELRVELAGSYILPAIEGRFRIVETNSPRGDENEMDRDVEVEILRTAEIFVEVVSRLAAAGESADIRDIKPLRPSPATTPWRLIAVLAVAALAAGVAALYYRRQRSEAAPAPAPAAHVVALEALRELRPDSFDSLQALRRYYFELSRVLRSYVEGRFALNATDMTTEEILGVVDELRLQGNAESLLADFLRRSDLVKFAAHVPSEVEIHDTYDRALSFVEQTRPPEIEEMAPA